MVRTAFKMQSVGEADDAMGIIQIILPKKGTR